MSSSRSNRSLLDPLGVVPRLDFDSISNSTGTLQDDQNRQTLRADIKKAREAGTLSEQTYLEISSVADSRQISSDEYKNFLNMFQGEVSGTSGAGKSRLGTQKLYELMIDQPGRRQTMLTPRSNASKSILGV